MAASLEDRLAELETRIAFIDDATATLGETAALHDRQLHELRTAMERLRQELVALRVTLASDAHDPHDEPPPPHY
jgi:SlyX protein